MRELGCAVANDRGARYGRWRSPRAPGPFAMTVAPSLGRPVGAVGEQTRARIITAAMRCVAEVGYSQTTIRQIARAADMTSGSLYHYFSSKSDLLAATVSAIEHTVMPRLRTASERDEEVVDRLNAVLDESDRLMREYPSLAAFDRAMRSESAARRADLSPAGFPGLRDVIAEIIGDARRDGSLSAETDAEGAVDVICTLARGLTEQAANLTPDAYHLALASAKALIRGTLFDPRSAPPRLQRKPGVHR